MKPIRAVWLILICILIMFCSFIASAHPGRTDANGGHWDRKTGIYHFHTGEYAGHSSSDSSSYKTHEPFTPPYKPQAENPYKNNKEIETASDTSIDVKEILEDILAIAFCIWYIGGFIFWDFEKGDGCFTFGISTILIVCLIGYLIEEKTEVFFTLILTVVVLVPLILKLKKKYTIALTDVDIYLNSFHRLDKCHKELFQIATQIESCKTVLIPDLYEINIDNLPKDKNSVRDWGKSFTLYKTNSGTKLHTKYNCCSAANPLHVYHCRNYHNFSKLLCKKCANDYRTPDMSWYENYLKCKQLIAEQQSIENNCNCLQTEIKRLHKSCNSMRTKTLIVFSRKTKKTLQEANYKYKKMQKDV